MYFKNIYNALGKLERNRTKVNKNYKKLFPR